MANIQDKLNNIKNALFGKDVRNSIHDGIDAINKEVESTTNRQEHLETTFDQLTINAGNSNAEIVDARVGENGKSYAKLGDRLDSVDSQLEQKAKNIDLVVERNRIDQITRLNEGSTTGDAELIDGRIGADGVIYDNIGDSIRNQVSNGYNIARTLPITDDITDEIKEGVYVVHTSNFGSYATLATVYTGIVYNIKPGTRYRVTLFSTDSSGKGNTCNFYDVNGKNISQGNTFYDYTLIDETNKIVEFTAPENAVTMTYTNYIENKSTGFCKNITNSLNIGWLEIEEQNLSKQLAEKLKNPNILTTEGMVTKEIQCDLRENGYYIGIGSNSKVMNEHYNTAYYTVTPNTVVRVKTYHTVLTEGFVIWFWNSAGSQFDRVQYESTIYDATNKIIDVIVPEGAVKMTVTEIASEDVYPVYELGGKISPKWLSITEDMLPSSVTDTNNAFKITTENKISDNIIYNYEWGYYLSVGGSRVENAGMGTAYFKTIPGNTYRIPVYSIEAIPNNNAVIYFWDKNGTCIAPTLYEYTVVEKVEQSGGYHSGVIDIIAPKDAILGTITMNSKNYPKNWWAKQVGGKFAPNWLEVSKDNLSNELLADIYNTNVKFKYNHCLAKPFDFRGKSSVFFGDSITHGVTSPNLGYTSNSYGRLFATSVGMSYESRAVSGSCFCPVNSPSSTGNNIYEKILAYTGTADYIFIAGGINDYSMQNPVGEYGDTTSDTVYGALHLICEHLSTNLPKANVIFITPVNDTMTKKSISVNVYRNAIFEMATSYGFNVVDGSQIGFPTEQGAFADAMCQDGVHPTELGHQFYAKSLRGILC